ncbi:putative transcription factor & chromatin remodeling ARID family [Helianthus anomalus]
MILQTMKFKEFLDCKALLDMMDDDEYVGKYKFILQDKFEEMVNWFITKKLGVTTRPIPAYASNNRKVCLLDLYLIIEREGGHRQVTENNLWPMIAKEIGFEYSDGELMCLMYAMYLDVLIYYYKFKTIQSNVQDKEMTQGRDVLGKRLKSKGCRSEGDGEEQDTDQERRNDGIQVIAENPSEQDAGQERGNDARQVIAENPTDHYAHFAGDSWKEIKRLNSRRKFDFNRAKAVVDDSNESVLKYSLKHNYV